MDSGHKHIVVLRDTGAWRMQVWISFALAILICAGGLLWLPGTDLDRAFMVMGYLFCLSSALVLAKAVRDQASADSDTPLWPLVVWGAFTLAMALTGWGLWRMDISPTWKAYLVVSWLYLISTAFTLAKTLRDGHEVERLERELNVAAGNALRVQAVPAAASDAVHTD